MSWTKDQQTVIDLRGTNILVAAAAGSGKTSVLVERILRLMLDEENPVDIDHMLVVTFTRAAAAQMKEKVRTALEQKADETPDDPRPSKQLALLAGAKITTIDGFCSYVLRSYGARIGLESGFRVADEGETKLLKADAVSALFEEEHQNGSPSFAHFMETFAPGRASSAPTDLLLALYEASSASPYPDKWLSGALPAPEEISWEHADRIPWMRFYCGEIMSLCARGYKLALSNRDLALRPDGPSAYRPVAKSEYALMKSLRDAGGDYPLIRRLLTDFTKLRLSSAKPKAGEDQSLREPFKNTRAKLEKILKTLREEYLLYDPDTLMEAQKATYPALSELVRLTRAFRDRYQAAKRDKNVLDYNDLEQYALRVLRDEEGNLTEAASELQDRFACVMIDEYQDSNYLQEAILTAVSRMNRGIPNYFMVGDVKQSIYSFRQARPDLFMSKYNRGNTETDRLIDLHANFRSRREVLYAVNSIFSQIMRKEVGDVDYDDAAALVYGSEDLYPEPPAAHSGSAGCPGDGFSRDQAAPAGSLDGRDPYDYTSECMIVYPPMTPDGKEASSRVRKEAEALAIAERIRRLTESTDIYDKKQKIYRRAEYGDIVILLRSLDSFAEILEQTLRRTDIPVYTTQKTGYFSAQEVQAVLSYLSILDNPLQDIPLAAVLRSPFVRLSAGELALIRMFGDRKKGNDKASFWECVQLYSEEGEDLFLRDRLSAFVRQYKAFRADARHLLIHELIFRIISRTGFSDYVRSMPGGIVRSGNLEMLITMAMEYEKTSYAGLFHFIRYINNLKEYKVDTGEAQTSSEGENAVRIMTIHGSKGLEFPIVFLARLDKKFNRQDLNQKVLIHPEYGIASNHIRLEDRIEVKTPARAAIRGKLKQEANGEELRVLYVAMTRAEQKLILSCPLKNRDALLDKKLLLPDDELRLPEAYLAGAESFADFVLPSLLRRTDFPCRPDSSGSRMSGTGRNEPWRILEMDMQDIRSSSEKRKEEGMSLFEELRLVDPEKTYCAPLHELYMERFHFHYPYEGLDRVPAKISVSELKAARYHDEETFQIYEEPAVIPLIPDFMKESPETLRGAARGTVYHKFMELLDYAAFADCVTHMQYAAAVEAEISRLKTANHLTEEEAAVIRPDDIAHFLLSPIGQRMREAALRGDLFRETPFTYAVPADTVDSSYPSSENILVQGVVDAWLIESGTIILIDYKTDFVASGDPEELVRKYRTQLLVYADALSRLTGLPVTEQYIYSFYLEQAIRLGGIVHSESSEAD